MSAEKIIATISGIMNAGGLTEYSFLGKGKVFRPENAMIITNARIILVLVPLPGAGEVIGSTNISLWQLLLAKKDIENKLKQMIRTMTLQQIIKSNPANYFIDFADIQKAKISFLLKNLVIKTKQGKTYKYSIRDKADREKAKEILKQFM